MNGEHKKPVELPSEDLVTALRDARKSLEEMNSTSFDGPPAVSLYLRAAAEIERLRSHVARRRDTLSAELGVALEEWKDAGAPIERVVIAIGNLVQQGIDFVIAEFDEGEKP